MSRPQPSREIWRDAFLAALRLSNDVMRSAHAARVSRGHVYRVREADPRFAAEWDAAALAWEHEEAAKREHRAVYEVSLG